MAGGNWLRGLVIFLQAAIVCEPRRQKRNSGCIVKNFVLTPELNARRHVLDTNIKDVLRAEPSFLPDSFLQADLFVSWVTL